VPEVQRDRVASRRDREALTCESLHRPDRGKLIRARDAELCLGLQDSGGGNLQIVVARERRPNQVLEPFVGEHARPWLVGQRRAASPANACPR
jgi:hypothetical protein